MYLQTTLAAEFFSSFCLTCASVMKVQTKHFFKLNKIIFNVSRTRNRLKLERVFFRKNNSCVYKYILLSLCARILKKAYKVSCQEASAQITNICMQEKFLNN